MSRNPAPLADRPSARWRLHRLPLFVQVAIAVVLGTALGVALKSRPFVPGTEFGNADLGQLAVLVTNMLKALAPPLIFFAVLDAFISTEITWERGRKLLFFSALNVTAAMLIGLCVMNVWRPGEAWRERLAQATATAARTSDRAGDAASASANVAQPPSLSLLESLRRVVPSSVVQPFIEGNLMSLILLAVLIGSGFRAVRRGKSAQGDTDYQPFAHVVATTFQVLLRVLEWVVRLVPFAVFGALAQSVAETGNEVFQLVGVYLAAICVGLALHALGYYTLVVWTFGGHRPRQFLRQALEPVLTALSSNSSLATVPVTLRTLTRLGVSDQSARLSACVGTNFNNDGITLYEAMTAIFLAQASGFALPLAGQMKVVAMCVVASLGAAGIPHGGLAVLPLVLASAGLSAPTIAAAMPLILTVDWIIARCRSGVNVMGDMTVAIQLDRSWPASGSN
jgi:DAACS family dicarboxylate/amino acid:cation (Na+ or H+) symporter